MPNRRGGAVPVQLRVRSQLGTSLLGGATVGAIWILFWVFLVTVVTAPARLDASAAGPGVLASEVRGGALSAAGMGHAMDGTRAR